MADLEGIILYKVLQSPNENLEHWSRLKPVFFSSDYLKIYSTIINFYENKGSLPSFKDLEIYIRNQAVINRITALKQLNVEDDIDVSLAIDALIDTYTQEETLKEIDTLVDDISYLNSNEIKEQLNNIALRIEDKTEDTDEVYEANQLIMFDEEELRNREPLGINNSFDAHTGGLAPSELIMIGGYRGTGKSVVSSNICVNQYLEGNVGLYFSIEMPANQVFRRNMAILSNVDASRLKKHKSTDIELELIAKHRSEMFMESQEILANYLNKKYHSYKDFEIDLIKNCELKPNNRMIIVKNRNLTLTDIDVRLSKTKERYGDHLKVCVVDYINQLRIPDMYDWKPQIELSKSLKNLAEKHEVVMITPYQVDKSGEARFSKGILDAADIALTLEKGEDYIKFKTSKIRDDADIEFASITDWNTLRIMSADKVFTEDSPEEEPKKKKTGDLPF